MIFRSQFIPWLAILTLWVAAPASQAAAPAKEDVEAAVTWFNSLEWPDVKGKPYVEIASGYGSGGSKKLNGPRTRGFLFAEDEKSFTILADGTLCDHEEAWPFAVRRILKPTSTPYNQPFAQKRVIELPAAVEELLADLPRPLLERKILRQGPAGKSVPSVAVFFLARCCARQGRADLAAKLDAALPEVATDLVAAGGKSDQPFRLGLEKGLAHMRMWRAVLDFGDLSFTRPELLAEFERIVRDFPDSQHLDSAKGYVAQLQKMIAEDEEHARTARPLAQMSEQEKVREWIFRLRDQHGHQFGQPGGVEIFDHLSQPGTGDSPADQLVRLGFAAVPALIESLGAPRPTRSVGYSRDFFYSHYVLSVGACAAEVVRAIGGYEYWQAPAVSPGPSAYGAVDKNLALAQQWWNELQPQGEKETLIEGVRNGGLDSPGFAQRLMALDPDAATDALLAGIRSGSAHWMRPQLISLLAEIKTETVTNALREQMKDCDSVSGRAAAATALLQRGQRKAVPAMIEECAHWQKGIGSEYWRWDPTLLFRFLTTSDDPATIHALARRFPDFSTTYKTSVLWSIPQPFPIPGRPVVHLSRAFDAALEEFLIKTLDDESDDLSGRRICDMAAGVLDQRWPDRYVPRAAITRWNRDALIADFRNSWRTKHGLAALPPPERPPILPASEDANTVAVCQWVGGPALTNAPIGLGRPLTADAFFDLLVRLYQQCPTDAVGLNIHADRAADRRGFFMKIEWVHGQPAGLDRQWFYHSEISVDGLSLWVDGARYPEKNRMNPASYEREKRALTEALADSTAENIVIHLHCTVTGTAESH